MMAIGMITRSAALMKFAIEHRPIVLVVLVNCATVTVIDMVSLAVCFGGGFTGGDLVSVSTVSVDIQPTDDTQSQTATLDRSHLYLADNSCNINRRNCFHIFTSKGILLQTVKLITGLTSCKAYNSQPSCITN